MKFTVIAGELEQGIAKVVFIKVAVPPPGSIGVGEMPRGGGKLISGKGAKLCFGMAPPVAGMSMDSGTVTGDSKILRGYHPSLDRGDDSREIKELLEAAFKVEGDAFVTEEAADKLFSDFRLRFGSFYALTFRAFRLFGIPGGRKEFIPGIKAGIRRAPETVHKIEIGTQWRERVSGAANECSQEAVIA